MKIKALIASALTALALNVQAAPVDLALSLVIDVSGSVDASEYNLQMDGYANAFRDSAIQTNLLRGTHGKAAVNVVFFGSNFYSTALDAFTVFSSAADINAFADILDNFARAGFGGTSIHAGTNRALDLMLAAVGTNGALSGTTNLVIDVSGDGNGSAASDRAARDRATANGVTINGLPIGGSFIENYYTANVITLDGFVEAAATFADFNDAVRNKIQIETGTIQPTPEPGSMALMGVALLALGVARRRQR